MIMVGDAAHPMLPTMAQGASQAVEDSAVLAICLELCSGDIPSALRVTQTIRWAKLFVIGIPRLLICCIIGPREPH